MSSRRAPGLSAFTARTSLSTSYATHGTALRAQTTTSLSTQLSVFRSLLHNFALTHAATIRSDPTFRQEFARMCAAVGVDPAAGVDDILRAVKSLKPLGSGFSIVTVGSKQMIRSIPKELNTDQSTVLEAIEVLGYATCSLLEDNLGWEHERAETVIGDLLGDSLVWVDLQSLEKEYWSPAFMNDFED